MNGVYLVCTMFANDIGEPHVVVLGPYTDAEGLMVDGFDYLKIAERIAEEGVIPFRDEISLTRAARAHAATAGADHLHHLALYRAGDGTFIAGGPVGWKTVLGLEEFCVKLSA